MCGPWHPTRLSRQRRLLSALKNGTPFLATGHWLAGTRIVSDEDVALLHREDAETTQLDACAANQCGGDLVEYRRHDQPDIRFCRCGLLAPSSAMSSDLFTPAHQGFTRSREVTTKSV